VGDVKQDFVKAVEIHKGLAKRGHLVSMHNLGSIYYHGAKGVEKDHKQAFKYIKMHVDRGEVNNICWLAYMLYRGEGVKTDVDKAIVLYEKAIAEKQVVAYSNLGEIYSNDKYGKKDIALSLDYYNRGVELGDKYSLNALGEIYQKGEIIEQDITKAVELYKQAVKQNFMHSQFNLAEIYEKGTGGIEINLEEAIKLYQASAKQKHEPAIEALKRLGVK
jgi:uncharacterized protein